MVVVQLPKDIKGVVFSDCIYVNELYYNEEEIAREEVESQCQDILKSEEKASGCL